MYEYGPHLQALYAYQDRLLLGHAPWRADQNRILAPLIIAAMERHWKIPYGVAYNLYTFYSFIVLNLSALVLFRINRLPTSRSCIGLFLVATTPLLLTNYWWFPWTNLEAILFLWAFIAMSAPLGRGMRITLIGVIFCLMILTKESCVFLPIWLFFYTVARNPRRIAVPAALTVAAVLVAFAVDGAIRNALWVSGTLPGKPSGLPLGGGPAPFGTAIWLLDHPVRTARYVFGNMWALATLRIPWPPNGNTYWYDLPAGIIAFLIGSGLSIAGFTWGRQNRNPLILSLSLVSISYLLVLLVFTNLPESDKQMPLLAFATYAYAELYKVTSMHDRGPKPSEIATG